MSNQIDIVVENNQFLLKGELSFFNVMALYEKSIPLLQTVNEFNFNFSTLTSHDSSALALIIEWVKLANSQHKKIYFHHLPTKLLSIVQAAKLEKLITSAK